jgi:hypothetical protein
MELVSCEIGWACKRREIGRGKTYRHVEQPVEGGKEKG